MEMQVSDDGLITDNAAPHRAPDTRPGSSSDIRLTGSRARRRNAASATRVRALQPLPGRGIFAVSSSAHHVSA